jgi:hypothetical protein
VDGSSETADITQATLDFLSRTIGK